MNRERFHENATPWKRDAAQPIASFGDGCARRPDRVHIPATGRRPRERACTVRASSPSFASGRAAAASISRPPAACGGFSGQQAMKFNPLDALIEESRKARD
jgi:hypothetical protein